MSRRPNACNRYAFSSADSTRSSRRAGWARSEEHTSELQSQSNLVCRLLLEKKKKSKMKTFRAHFPPERSKPSELDVPPQAQAHVRRNLERCAPAEHLCLPNHCIVLALGRDY